MLELKNVSKTYSSKSGDVRALDNINLYFGQTGMVFITGKSGSGKTTLLNCIGGLDDFEGEIIIKGKSTLNFTRADFDSYRNTYIGFVFQEYNLLDSMTIAKNINLATELQGVKDSSSTIKKILEKVDLKGVENRKPQELSGGQRQRVAIARALVKNPSIIMADEPTGALDSENGLQIIELLKKLSKDKLVIVVSHDLELANNYADRIINLKDGKVESDITITIDNEKERNIMQKSSSIAIRRGAELTETDLTEIKEAVKNNKDVFVSDNINVIKKETKTERKEEYNDNSPFLKTKMSFWATIKLGLNALKSKKIRLVITVLLCAIAFAVFGVFDAMAIYDETRLTANAIKSSITPSTVITPQVLESVEDEPYNISVNDVLLDSLKSKTGYDFKGVYDSYYFGTQPPSELGNNSIICKFSKYYYYKKLNGAVEFSNDELKKYGFSVKYGELPNSYDEIAISEYFANCMLNWYYTYKDSNGNSKNLEDFDDLVSHITDDQKEPLTLTLGTSETRVAFKIVGIIDVGKINKKFNSLLSDFDNSSSSTQNEFLNYINNSFNLYGFMKPGFSRYAMRKYNALSLFINKAYAYQFTNKDTTPQYSNTFTSTVGNFYNFEELKQYQETLNEGESEEKQSLYFFIDDSKTSLEGNEILVDIKQFRNLYSDYISYLKKMAESTKMDTDPESSFLYNYPAEIDNYLNLIEGTATNDEKIDALKEIVEMLDKIQVYVDNIYSVERQGSVLERKLIAKKLDASTPKDIEMPLKNKEYKIVGFYSGLHLKTGLSVITSINGMANLGISTMQGDYSTIIATKVKKGNVNALTKILLSKLGYCYKLHNTAISVIRINGDFFSNLSILFLIVSGVFALFSIAMFSNIIISSIKSKYVEIGILRALGAKGSDILKMFLIEVLAISLINVVFASILSGIGCIFVNMYLANQLGLYISLASFGIRQVLVIFGLSLAVGIISAIIPLISVAKQKPVETIRKAF